jgi:anaerobic magnesium-protoporphyrin IX monomethyl ester cyclase
VKILLVNPRPRDPFTVYGPSLGLCYLSAYLKRNGMTEIEGIDLNVDSPEDLSAAIGRSDLVGVHCSTKGYTPSLEVARAAKAAGKIVVFGGPHPSVLPGDVLANDDIDYVVLSEGEVSFHELLQALESGSPMDAIDGIGYKTAEGIHISPKTTYVEDLDTLPWPDRDLFHFDRSKFVTFCATRGCPYKCANCQPALSLQTCAFRTRSVEDVIEELREVASGKIVHFVDNDLTIKRSWTEEFCRRVIEEDLHISWGCQGRVNTLDRDLLQLMKDAGCNMVGLGIESGSQELLDRFLHKGIKLSRVDQLLKDSHAVGLPLHGWFILGIPTETKADIESTIAFALAHDFAQVGFSIGTPWPGTRFYQVSKDNGWMLTDDWDEFNEKRVSRLRTDDWGPEDIAEYRDRIIEAFRAKGWHVDADDFVFGQHFWRFGPFMRTVLRATKPLHPAIRSVLAKFNAG